MMSIAIYRNEFTYSIFCIIRLGLKKKNMSKSRKAGGITNNIWSECQLIMRILVISFGRLLSVARYCYCPQSSATVHQSVHMSSWDEVVSAGACVQCRSWDTNAGDSHHQRHRLLNRLNPHLDLPRHLGSKHNTTSTPAIKLMASVLASLDTSYNKLLKCIKGKLFLKLESVLIKNIYTPKVSKCTS